MAVVRRNLLIVCLFVFVASKLDNSGRPLIKPGQATEAAESNGSVPGKIAALFSIMGIFSN